MIENASIDDINDISLLEIKLFDKNFYSFNMLKVGFKNPNYIYSVYKANNNLIGYLIAVITSGECEILKIGVDLIHQRAGIGSKLIKNLIKTCEKNRINEIFLEVEEQNFSAIKLYEKFNFTKIAKRTNYYGLNKDALIYKLDISNN